MSSPSSEPGNAAALSTAGPAQRKVGGAASPSPENAPSVPAPSARGDGSPPAATQPPNVAAQCVQSAHITPAPAIGVVELSKKPRQPALTQRAAGPSLLTQALNSARGKHTAGSADVPHTAPKSPSHPYDGPGSQPKSDQNGDPATNGQPADHDLLSSGDGGSLTPRGPSRPVAMVSPFPTTTSLPASADGPASSSTRGLQGLGDAMSNINGHRELPTQPDDLTSASQRPNKDKRLQDSSTRIGTQSTVASSQIVSSPTSLERSLTQPNANVEDSTSTNSRPSRPRKMEHRLSMGPEKAWSIGSTELTNTRDGKVEKSITEVLAGVEPNRGSRKASHSMRFFQEGLPEEKAKRKETKLPTPLREKLPTAVEASSETESTVKSKGDQSLSKLASPSAEELAARTARAVPVPVQSPSSPPTKDTTENHVGHVQDAKPPVGSLNLPYEAANGRLEVAQTPSGGKAVASDQLTKERQESGDSTEVGESAEDGDDSGEEKISSALFVPHQGLEVEACDMPPVPGVISRSNTGARTTARGEGYRSWLVKADEPEADDQAPEVQEFDPGHRQLKDTRYTNAVEPPSAAGGGTATGPFDVPDFHPARLSRPVSQYEEEHFHDHQLMPRQPLDAIELIPYKHQVGGHTTLWRFSRRAVCKQLNNRENEFYETIERYHRDLLPFLPRYIGVLNVTFQKQSRRKSTLRKDDGAASERRSVDQIEGEESLRPNGSSGSHEVGQHALENPGSAPTHERVISQSLQSSQTQVPTVSFVDNRHILPRNLLQPSPGPASVPGRFRSISASVSGATASAPGTPRSAQETSGPARPSLESRHANSWGATMVNKRLRNEVFNDAFLKEPIAIHRHKKAHRRALPRKTMNHILRPSNSESSLKEPERQPTAILGRSSGDVASRPPEGASAGVLHAAISALEAAAEPEDVTGTSAPEADILTEPHPPPSRKRRYSGTALRRKPQNVTEPRGELKYFEEPDEAGYRGDNEDTMAAHLKADTSRDEVLASPKKIPDAHNGDQIYSAPNHASTATSGTTSPVAECKMIPRPVNPKEAQTQKDSRREYYLLLEDLTAGMKKPCIMDLKMGTRQYGVDATPKKQKSQRCKCAGTTSRELGVRVCGLQVWDVGAQEYIFRDKYYGRDLKAGGEFQEALTRFLYDGVEYSSILRHIPTILQKLSQLEVTIRRLRGYRFYAASLLMFYDGEPSDDGNDTAIDDSTTDFATDTEECRDGKRRKSKRDIDFKMADFANCVTGGDRARDRPCPPQHPDEPDRGFLRGLQSLRKYFLKIQRDVRGEMGLAVQQRNGADNHDADYSDDEGSVSE